MKQFAIILLSICAAAGLSAFPLDGPHHPILFGEANYFKNEVKAVESEFGARKIGESTLNELKPFLNRLSVAGKKDLHVERSAAASFRLPGLGQFQNGNVGGGLAFLGLNLLTIGGGLVWAYSLLPAELRFDKLDYWSASSSDVRSAWNSKAFKDFLPSIGAIAAGALANLGVRFFSARSAAGDAKARIDSGNISFEPEVGAFFLGIDMRMR
jgi:hypothetical protein